MNELKTTLENSVTPLAAPRRGLVLQVPHCASNDDIMSDIF
jgi:hypothetical protein